MAISPPASDVLFSQVREDPLLDLDVARRVAARRGAAARVLLIASGGCTAVSLLADDAIAEVHAVDANPAQLHLTALRQQAALALDADDVRELLDGAIERYARVRDRLPAAAREHWDARPDELRFGVNRAGRFEALFRELQHALASRGIDAVADPRGAIAHAGWRTSFQQVFERGKLARAFGEAAVAYSMDRSFADHFEQQFASALGRWPVDENYFLHQVLRDAYPADPAHAPPYLAPGFRAAAARLGGDRLWLHTGRFADRLPELAAAERFDMIQISNISDWMSLADLDALLDAARAGLSPGGAIVGRRLNGDHVLADRIARRFDVDRALGEALTARDRSFFYREVVVAWA